jgi:hypothetical protein
MEFVRFVWISGRTVNLALLNIKSLVFIIEAECLQRGTD